MIIETIHDDVYKATQIFDIYAGEKPLNRPCTNSVSIDISGLSLEVLAAIPEGEFIGQVNYVETFNPEVYCCDRFHPFSTFKDFHVQLTGLGIADWVQRVVAEMIFETLPGDVSVVHGSTKKHRINQLQRLGIKTKRKYPIGEYVATILKNTEGCLDERIVVVN